MSRLILAVLAGSLALGMACAGGQGRPHRFTESIVEGVVVARNEGGPKYAGELFRYEPQAVLVQDEGDPASLLNRPEEVVVDEAGRFYVNDRWNARIAVFAPDGRYERSIGRQGQGPGEVSTNIRIVALADGVLTVTDHPRRRINRFSTDGTFLGSYRNPIPAGGHLWPIGDGRLLTISNHTIMREREDGLWLQAAGFCVHSAEGDSLAWALPPVPHMKWIFTFATPGSGKGGMSRPRVPFTSDPDAVLVPGEGVLLGRGQEPLLWFYDFTGRLVRTIDIGLDPRPVTSALLRRFYDEHDARMMAGDEAHRDWMRRCRTALIFPEVIQLWDDVAVDTAGYVWLQVMQVTSGYEPAPIGSRTFYPGEQVAPGAENQPGFCWGGGSTYYLLSPEGELLGTTTAPVPGRAMRGRFVGTVTDPGTGAEEITVWRLIAAAEGFVYP